MGCAAMASSLFLRHSLPPLFPTSGRHPAPLVCVTHPGFSDTFFSMCVINISLRGAEP
jgi:hypothetical protein